jgi:hypothetical protein
MTPGQTLALLAILLLTGAAVSWRMIWRKSEPTEIKLPPLPVRTHVPVTDGSYVRPAQTQTVQGPPPSVGNPIELRIKIFGGPDNGEEITEVFPADTAGFIAELEKLRTFRKMKSKVFLAMEPEPHILINRGLYVEFVNDHVATEPPPGPSTAPSPFRRRHPGTGGQW